MAIATTTIKVSKNHQRMAEAMRDAGCPRDQAASFMQAGYVPLKAMLPFHAAAREADKQMGADMIGVGGTRGPGKSYATLAQAGLDDCQRAPGLKVLFLRKVMKSASESLEDLVYQVFRYQPYSFPSSKGRVDFPNGSRILIGGFNNESDVDKYLGIEYDEIVVEEATQLSDRKIDMIRGSLRSTRPDWRARMYLTTNPDGIGLQWFKQTFVIPHRTNTERWTKFIPASYKNNPHLKPEYIRYLEGLKGPLGRAWRDADWDAFEGMAFPHWNHDAHVIEPQELPHWWLRWRAVDWGFAAPWCCLWFAKEPDTGRIYIYREAYQDYLTDTQQAQRILDMTTPDEEIAFTFADPSMWSRKVVENRVTTTADTYNTMGVVLTKADNDRLSGKRKVNDVLGNLADGKPGIQIFSTCQNLIRTLPTLPFDDVHIEDVDTTAEDHAYDALKYGLTNMQLKTLPRPEPQLPYSNPLSGRNF